MKLGIDFGTCFSFMATMVGTKVQTALLDRVDVENGGCPSLFMHTKNPSMDYFGRDAFVRRREYPNDYIKEIKKDIRMNPNRIAGDSTYTYVLGGKYYKAEAIVESFIRYLVEIAKKNALTLVNDNDRIDEITITAPVGLTSDKKAMEATALYNEMLIRVAKKVTGIEDDSRVHVLGEPVAAAMYNIYKKNSTEKQTILVYDLGGGTFDAAIVEYNPKAGEKGKFEPIATGGYTDVGGGDWDNCLKAIVKKKTNFSGINIEGRGYVPENANDRETFEQSIIEAKIKLSRETKAWVNFDIGTKETHSVYITREEFEKESKPYLEKTIKIVEDVIRIFEEQKGLSAGKGLRAIDRIVLVGGSSQMPQVRQRLIEKFSSFPADSIYLDDPQIAIAAGAAINNDMPVRARVLHTYGVGSNYAVDEAEYNAHKDDKFVDPDDGESKSKYWIQEEDGVKEYKRRGVSNIIMKGAPIDSATGYAMASQTYHPSYNKQTQVEFSVYISESSDEWSEYEKPSLFGYTVDIPSEFHGKAREYSIEAEFRITDDGVVVLKTYEKKGDKRGKEIGYGRFPK